MPDNRIQLGVIGRPHGVRGLVRVTSHTANPADLTAYGPLSDGDRRQFVLHWKAEGVAEVSEIVGGALVKVTDRSAAEKLTNTRLFIDRALLPPPGEEDEYYLADLIGLRVVTRTGAVIGHIATVHDYGAGASIEIQQAGGASLILPFTRACVPDVDIPAGQVTVTPPEEVIVDAKPEAAA